MKKTPFTLEDLKNFVESNSNCKLLECDYKNADSVIGLKCSCGERFDVKFRNFKYQGKRMCDSCKKELNFIEKGIISKREHLEAFVKEKSDDTVKVVSVGDIKNIKSKAIFKCHCGENFENSIYNIKQNDKIQCNECKVNIYRYSLQDFEVEGVKVLNFEDYKNEDSVLKFLCGCGEQFDRTVRSYVLNKKICSKCSSLESSNNQKMPFEKVLEIVSKTKCKILSNESEYVNQYSNLRFLCDCGQEFYRGLSNFRRREPKCTTCSQSYGEYQVEKFLKENGFSFEKEYKFKDLIGKSKPLRFDFAVFENGQLIFLIEYDGEFHYEEVLEGHDLVKQKFYDEKKNRYCKENNLKLIRIPYWNINRVHHILDYELKSKEALVI